MLTFITGVLLALLLLGAFLLGVRYHEQSMANAATWAEYLLRKHEAYRLAGYERIGDPQPYVAPPVAHRTIPHLNTIENRLRHGRRSTVIIKGGNT